MAVLRTFLFSLLLCLGSATAFGQASSAERAALIDFYHATGGGAWHDNTNWLAAEGTECQWFGVQCASPGGEHFVLRLMLTDNNLTGELPNSLAGLDGLQTLYLGDNQLHGSIPESLWDLPELAHLSLASNQFEGSVPAAVLGLHSGTPAAQLDLSGNLLDSFSLAGLPVAPADQPFRARLADNLFSELPPVEWRETGNLRDLDLSRNRLEGTVTPGDAYWPGLEILTLSGNAISELTDLSAAFLPELVALHLGGNRIEQLPESLTTLETLINLDASNNRLAGELPEWFAELNLARLRLDNNALSGPVSRVFDAMDVESFPIWQGPHGRLGLTLHVANNHFHGALPDIDFSIFNLPSGGQSPEFGLDLCFNDIELPDSEALAAIDKVHRGLALAPCIGRKQIPVDPTISGSWFALERNGEGLTQMLLDNGQLLSYWFTYTPPDGDAPPEQMWLFGLSEPGESWSEFRPLWTTSGGQFDQGLGGGAPRQSPAWMRQNRLDADNLHFLYDYRGGGFCITGACYWEVLTERFDLTRLTRMAGTSCDVQTHLQQYSGAWYNPERAGEGFIVEVLPDDRAVVYWFTYTPDGSGEQAWMIGTGELEFTGIAIPLPPPGTPEHTLKIDTMFRPSGTVFGSDFESDDIEFEEWGSLTMEFWRQATGGHVHWESNDENFGSGDYEIEMLARPMLAECGE